MALSGCLRGLACGICLLAAIPPLLNRLDATPLAQGSGLEVPASMAGQTVLITGSSKGIGFEAAKEFSRRGANVIVTGRTWKSTYRAAEGVAQVAREPGKATPMVVDMSNFADVRRFAGAMKRRFLQVDVLILNAGISYGDKFPTNTTAPSGHDLAYATNHLGHFLLYKLLRSHLKEGTRVVVVGSGTMWAANNRAALTPESRPLYESKMRKRRGQAYAVSKLANKCFMHTLRRRMVGRAASVTLYNPGITATEMLGAKAAVCSKALFLNWCGPADAAGRMLMESAYVSKPFKTDVLQAYWWPRFVFDRYAPMERWPLRVQSGWVFGYPGKIQRLLNWGTLHSTVGPACDVPTQEKLWKYSEKATGAPP